MQGRKGLCLGIAVAIGLFCIFSTGYLVGTHRAVAPYFVATQRPMVEVLERPQNDGIDSLLPDEIININTASEADLDRLPGIGEALASRIVAHRESQGAFETVEDIVAVDGIGTAILASIQPHITVG